MWYKEDKNILTLVDHNHIHLWFVALFLRLLLFTCILHKLKFLCVIICIFNLVLHSFSICNHTYLLFFRLILIIITCCNYLVHLTHFNFLRHLFFMSFTIWCSYLFTVTLVLMFYNIKHALYFWLFWWVVLTLNGFIRT